jgi:hypothetical protein
MFHAQTAVEGLCWPVVDAQAEVTRVWCLLAGAGKEFDGGEQTKEILL